MRPRQARAKVEHSLVKVEAKLEGKLGAKMGHKMIMVEAKPGDMVEQSLRPR